MWQGEALRERVSPVVLSLLLHSALLALPAASLLRGDPLPPRADRSAIRAPVLVELAELPPVRTLPEPLPPRPAANPRVTPAERPATAPEPPAQTPAARLVETRLPESEPAPPAADRAPAQPPDLRPAEVTPPATPATPLASPTPATPAGYRLLTSTSSTAPEIAVPVRVETAVPGPATGGTAAKLLEAPQPRPVERPAPAQTQAPAPAVPLGRVPARLTYRPEPVYPPAARREGQVGTVRLRLEVRADGRVGEVLVAETSGFTLLDQAAVKAARTWRFDPARENDHPVAEWRRVAVEFRLENGPQGP